MKLKYVLIILITLIVIWPVYWMVQGSFQDHWGVFTIPSAFIPQGLHVRNYIGILGLKQTDQDGVPVKNPFSVLRWCFNTVQVIMAKAAITLIIVAPAGMAFALYKFHGKKVLFWLFLSTIMIPGNSILIGKFIVTRAIGLSDTLLAAIVPVCFNAVGIFLFRTFVEEIPTEILDQARVDGAGELRILGRVIMPLCVPVIGVILLFMTLGTLNNYLWQSIVLQRMEIKTLLVGMVVQMQSLALLFAQDIDPLGLRLAAGTVLLIPSMLLFIFFNKRFIKEINLGALIK